MNRITSLLAFGTFGIITTEFGVIGILPDIAATYEVGAERAGAMVSLFALVVGVSGPFITLLSSRFGRKQVVQLALLVFIVSNILSAYAHSFGILLFARILPAFFLPPFFSHGVLLATTSVPKEKGTQAVATLYLGMSVASVIGIPFIAFIAGFFGWKNSFLFMGAINSMALAGVSFLVPEIPFKRISVSSNTRQLSILKKRILWVHILTVILIFTGAFSVYSYMAEYLKEIYEMGSQHISYMLMVFGITGIFGNWVAGIALGKSIEKTLWAYTLSMVFIFFVLNQAGTDTLFQGLLVGVWGFFHMAGFLICQVWISASALEAPELANSLVVSTANLGIASGAVLGGEIISNFGIQQVVWVGIAAFSLSLISIWGSTAIMDVGSD